MHILPYKTADSNRNLTARAGLVVIADLFKRLGLNGLADRFMPAPGSNRGYRPSVLFSTFMLMKLLGFEQVPEARTLGNWLRRMSDSRQSIQTLVKINKHLPSAGLHHCRRVTPDIDVTVIECNKKGTEL